MDNFNSTCLLTPNIFPQKRNSFISFVPLSWNHPSSNPSQKPGTYPKSYSFYYLLNITYICLLSCQHTISIFEYLVCELLKFWLSNFLCSLFVLFQTIQYSASRVIVLKCKHDCLISLFKPHFLDKYLLHSENHHSRGYHWFSFISPMFDIMLDIECIRTVFLGVSVDGSVLANNKISIEIKHK